MESLTNIFWLGMKELRSFRSDRVLAVFVVYAFTLAIYTQATGSSSEVNNASIGFVDEDHSQLSGRIIRSFYPPRFRPPVELAADEVDDAMDGGKLMFVVAIPPRYELNLRAGRSAEIQVNIDATAMQQASIGASYIQNIIAKEVSEYLSRSQPDFHYPTPLVVRKEFNPNGETSWFNSVVAIINQITLLTTILTGAALIREREHGTIEHLLVMPLSAFEIAAAKIWSNALVILTAATASLWLVVRGVLHVPIAGSPALFLAGMVLYLFYATALGVFLGTIARTMAQFALLIVLIVIVLQLLSGGSTPVESQPIWLQRLTFFLPSRHFVTFSQAILYRGAGIRAVWPNFLAVAAIGAACLIFSLQRFRQSISMGK